jgi:uncharacterized membrane protein HdeD (DUF308 family)
MDLTALSRNWWAIAIRGVAAIVFGILAFVWPGITLAALILLFGAYAVVDGIFTLIAALRGGDRDRHRGWLVLEGVVSIGAGIVAFAWPGLTALALVFVIAAWAIVTGVLEIVAAVRLRKHIRNEWWLVLGGVLSVAFGVLLLVAPAVGALALVFWIGAYAILFGALLLGLAFRLRQLGKETPERLARAA